MVSTLFVEPIATQSQSCAQVPGETIRALKPSAASFAGCDKTIEHGDEPGGAKRYWQPGTSVEARRDGASASGTPQTRRLQNRPHSGAPTTHDRGDGSLGYLRRALACSRGACGGAWVAAASVLGMAIGNCEIRNEPTAADGLPLDEPSAVGISPTRLATRELY